MSMQAEAVDQEPVEIKEEPIQIDVKVKEEHDQFLEILPSTSKSILDDDKEDLRASLKIEPEQDIKILPSTSKFDSEDDFFDEDQGKKEMPELKEEMMSEDEDDESDFEQEGLSDDGGEGPSNIKTEELMIKSESGDSDSRTITEMKWNAESLLWAYRAAKILISLSILLTLRLAILQGTMPKFSVQDNPAAFHPSLSVRILTFSYLAALNWWLLLCPSRLSHDWQMGSIPLVTSMTDSRLLLTCFFFGITFSIIARISLDFENQRISTMVLGFMLLVFPFLPASNLLVTVGFVVAERVLYIPSMGSILLVVYGMQTLWYNYCNHRQTLACFVMLLLTTGCFRTVLRNKDWGSRESLLRAGLMTLPQNAKMHYNYANFLRDSGRPELAKTYYRSALKLWPSYASAHNNLGTLLNDEMEAEQHFLAAIRYSAEHVNAHYNLGQLYRKSNRSLESEEMLRKCIFLEPKFKLAYIELVKLRGETDPRIHEFLEKIVDWNLTNPYYRTALGDWLLEKVPEIALDGVLELLHLDKSLKVVAKDGNALT